MTAKEYEVLQRLIQALESQSNAAGRSMPVSKPATNNWSNATKREHKHHFQYTFRHMAFVLMRDYFRANRRRIYV